MDSFEQYIYRREQEVYAVIVGEFRRAFRDAKLCSCPSPPPNTIIDCEHVRQAIEVGFGHYRKYLSDKGDEIMEGDER